jgi:hypothetical protein
VASAVERLDLEVPVAKAIDPGEMASFAAEVRTAVRGACTPDTAPIAAVLRKVYGDAYLAGAHVGATQVGGAATVTGSLGELAAGIDWGSWAPGYAGAANLVADGGLAALLAQAELIITGTTATTLDQIGTILAHGLAAGDSIEGIAGSLTAGVDDGSIFGNRAFVIADTEAARAMTAAANETYRANGVDQVAWLLEADACDECVDNGDASPISINDDWPAGDVPVHPNCRCAVAPAVGT